MLYISNTYNASSSVHNVPLARYQELPAGYGELTIKLPVELGLEKYAFNGTLENGSPIHYEPGHVKMINITLRDYLFE